MTDVIGKRFALYHKSGTDKRECEFGRLHRVDLMDKVVLVEVVETKTVRGTWSNKTCEGWRAIGSDGHEYLNNWTQFNDASYSPRSYWVKRIEDGIEGGYHIISTYHVPNNLYYFDQKFDANIRDAILERLDDWSGPNHG